MVLSSHYPLYVTVQVDSCNRVLYCECFQLNKNCIRSRVASYLTLFNHLFISITRTNVLHLCVAHTNLFCVHVILDMVLIRRSDINVLTLTMYFYYCGVIDYCIIGLLH